MDKPFILHMITSAKNLSPFDVNMALDAGWISALPYLNVTVDEITGLVQDAIFSRSLKTVKRTGIFIGGRDTLTAMQMLRAAQKSMIPPFEISAFADPSGAFTTAAAMVAVVENHLRKHEQSDLAGLNVVVLGGTGPCGQIAAVLCAEAGSKVKIVGRQREKACEVAEMCNKEFGQGKTSIQGEADANKGDLLQTADIVFATGAAGIQLLSAEMLAAAPRLKVAADLNAVPPSGIAGLSARHKGTPIEGSCSNAVGFGALAIGSVKYQTQSRLLQMMRELKRETDKPAFLHYDHAFEMARRVLGG